MATGKLFGRDILVLDHDPRVRKRVVAPLGGLGADACAVDNLQAARQPIGCAESGDLAAVGGGWPL